MTGPPTTMDIELSDDLDWGYLPPPACRHAVPSAPWPWIDTRDCVDQKQLNTEAPPIPKDCDHTTCRGLCWKGYPQSRFPNWTPNQVRKCKILDAITNYDRAKQCIIYKIDVNRCGIFLDAGKLEVVDSNDDAMLDREWDRFKDDNQTSDVRVRALFVENMSGPALRMLGGKYNIEPFFFSSSLNWTPSHFQEDLRLGVGDHVTITLPFIQSLDARNEQLVRCGPHGIHSQFIYTQGPLLLISTKKTLVPNLLSVHLVRNKEGNTLISYHTNKGHTTTKAAHLHERVRFAGQSVYWQKILGKTHDPTFLLLIFVWHAVYAWDEALQHLHQYICMLETNVIGMSSGELTEEVHLIRAHLLHYSALLVPLEKIVKFILNTPNPALTPTQKEISISLLNRECKALLEEVELLDKACEVQEDRLTNVLGLKTLSRARLHSSKIAQRKAEVRVRDSPGTS